MAKLDSTTKLNELKINIVDTYETFGTMEKDPNQLYFIEQELPVVASSLETGHTFKVNLASENASSTFNGTADITDIGVSNTLPVKHGGTGFTTATYKNAVVIGNSSTVTNQLQTVRTASGAFYATGQDIKPSFGTLPVAQGGTGQTSIDNIQAGKDSAGNTITSTYLKLSGGNMTGHIYLTGSQANSSTANTSQLIFGTSTTEHIAISSNTKALILNPTHNSTTNQIVLYLDKASKFPSGIEANITGNLTGKATTAGTADIANSVAWNNVSSKPDLVNKITTTAGAHTVIANQAGNVSFNVPTMAAHVGAAAKEITIYNPSATFYIKTDFLASQTQNMIYGYLQGNGYSGTPPIHVDFQVYNYTATSLINGKQYDATGAIGQMSCFRGTDGYLYIKVERGAGNQTFKIFIYKMSHGNDENHAIEVLSTAPEMEAGSEHIFTKYTGIHDGIFTTAYDMIYANASNKATRLGPNKSTTKKFLRMTGTGSDGAAPAWDTVNKGDVGLENVENTKLSTWAGSSNITTIGTLSSGTVPWARLSGIPAGANKLIQDEITIQTGDTTQQHITLQTLMTWLITTKKYIPSNTECYKYLPVSWAYASNDILQLSCNGTNYELQLAGCIIEFWGKATNYNTGVFRLGIHSNPSANFTANSGYTKFPNSSYVEYTCNGSSYNQTWRMVTAASNSAPSLSWGTSSTIGSVNGVNLTVTMPANPNTDTKVTSVDNHYTPTANTNSELTATLSGTAGNYAINTEYTVLTGVKAQRDTKGHITGLTYTAQKIKDTNTTYTLADLVGSTAIGSATKPVYWNGSKFAAITYNINKDVPSDAVFTDTKVTQNNTTEAKDYRILFSASANDIAETNTVNKNANLKYNPSTNTLTTSNLIITGTATAQTPATTSNDTSVATTAFVKNNLGGLSGAMHFKGITTTALDDGTTTADVTIGSNSYTPSAGDVVLYSDSEFVWTGSAWERLGRDSSFKVQQDAVTTATTADGTTTTFVSSVTQDANGVITVTKQAMPTYNNYNLPLAASGTRGGIQIGYTQSEQNYPVQLSNEKAYVNVPWTDTKNTAGSTDTTNKIFLIGATSQAANPQTYSDSEVYVQNGSLYLVRSQDASGTANNKPALIVGGADTTTHMEIDANEIQAKSNGTTTGALYLNNDGGLVTVGSGGLTINSLTASQAISTDANKKLVSTNLTVSDSTTDNGIQYIYKVTQSAVGKITVSKSTIRSATTSQTGIVQLTDSIDSTSTTTAATPNVVKTAYDLANTANTTADNHKYWANIEATASASYGKSPEVATLKLNGNTSATAASTSNVSLVYNSTTQALNFIFA